MDSNRFNFLVEKSGLGVKSRRLLRPIKLVLSRHIRGSALSSGHRMQCYGIKIRFLSGCSAGVARVVRDDEVEGSNPFTPTNY